MLRKDFELFCLATKVELHDEELWDAADSMINAFMVIGNRYSDLVGKSWYFIYSTAFSYGLFSAISATKG